MVSKAELLNMSPQQWAQTNNNAAKEAIQNNPEIPLWQKLGFGSEAQYFDAYHLTTPAVATPVVQQPQAPTRPLTFDEYIRDNPDSADAWSYLSSLLGSYGLSGLDSFAQDAIVKGFSSNEIVQRIRTTDQYKERFQAIEQRKAAGLPAISEAEVINYEKEATRLMRAAGLTSGFWDSPDDFVNLQVKDVSLSELQARINEGYVAATQMPSDVQQQWAALGYTTGDLAAYMLDPDRTEAALMKQVGAVQQAAEAQRAGFGQLTKAQAEQLQALGISAPQAQQGFQNLYNQRELMNALPGEAGVEDIDKEQQLQATFQNNVKVQQQLQRTAAARAATFQNGTSFSNNKEGYAGVGVAR